MPLHDTVQTGIEAAPLLPGLVPLFEEREAATFGQYTWEEWRVLEYGERALGIAYYRLHRVVDMHRSDAVQAEVRRKNRPRQGM